MRSGSISSAIQSIWKKAGLKLDMSCTLYRKAAVTGFHKENAKSPEKKKNLASAMLHQDATAERSYKLIDKERGKINEKNK